MTEYVVSGRAGGKTRHALTMMLEQDDLYYLGHDPQSADRAYEACLELAEERDIPLTEEETRALRKRFMRYAPSSGAERRRIVVDNVELLLARYFHSDIVAVTGTGHTRWLPGTRKQAEMHRDHRITLGYTTDDDGIWMNCSTCGPVKNLGHAPDVAAIAIATTDHINALYEGVPAHD